MADKDILKKPLLDVAGGNVVDLMARFRLREGGRIEERFLYDEEDLANIGSGRYVLGTVAEEIANAQLRGDRILSISDGRGNLLFDDTDAATAEIEPHRPGL